MTMSIFTENVTVSTGHNFHHGVVLKDLWVISIHDCSWIRTLFAWCSANIAVFTCTSQCSKNLQLQFFRIDQVTEGWTRCTPGPAYMLGVTKHLQTKPRRLECPGPSKSPWKENRRCLLTERLRMLLSYHAGQDVELPTSGGCSHNHRIWDLGSLLERVVVWAESNPVLHNCVKWQP